ncbi:hypothetical protein ZOSMA_452G00090 [Zostera marina]|uniref:Uncharacterized protein n=1 Tax=Zostera marina TaxID=29655 RepID=A0A0K9P0R5_ZOSMR|nr:hypothetical protein ZOSMA_452G00090 [Zostera marina]
MIPQDPLAASPVEKEEEEKQIEKFGELLKRIQQMRQDCRDRGSSRRRGKERNDDPSWKPKFAVEDFKISGEPERGNNGGGGGRVDIGNRLLLGVGRKRKAVEADIMRTGVAQGLQNRRKEQQVSTELNLTLEL